MKMAVVTVSTPNSSIRTAKSRGSQFRVNTYTTGSQIQSDAAMDAAGDFVVTWESVEDGSLYGVYAQKYYASGTAEGSEFRVNSYTTGNQDRPAEAMDTAGDFVVAWQRPARMVPGMASTAQALPRPRCLP